MESVQQIALFKSFIEKEYMPILSDNLRKDKKLLIINFNELSKFNLELAEVLLEQPEDIIKAAELAIDQLDLENSERTKVRFCNLPKDRTIKIRDIRSKHLNKLYQFEGIIRQKSDIRPQVTAAKFECPSCGNIINVLQLEQVFKEPSRCGCGRKGRFHLINKELIDAQGMVIEEDPSDLDGDIKSKRINCILKDDLVSPFTSQLTLPGKPIRVIGVINEVPILLRSGGKSIRSDLVLEANNLEQLEENITILSFTEEEKQEFKEMADDPQIIEKIVQSIAPEIHGLEKEKEATALWLVQGVKKVSKDKQKTTRAFWHLLLIGDPGSGKTALLREAKRLAYKCSHVSGKGASGPGLTACVVKDEFLQQFALEAGAIPLSHGGYTIIDEVDKMDDEVTSHLHEQMESGTITINKANIQAQLKAETELMMAANPKYGRFDYYGIIADQINLPAPLINRFDLIFAVKDIPTIDKDTQLAQIIIDKHKDIDKTTEGKIPSIKLKRYLQYVRHFEPKITQVAEEKIKTFFIKIRNPVNNEGGVKVIPISARQLESLIRLAEGYAKLRLSNVEELDAGRAIDMLNYSLEQVGMNEEGKVDIDRIATGIGALQRDALYSVTNIINNLTGGETKSIEISCIVDEARKMGIKEEYVNSALDILKRKGDIFNPRGDLIQPI